MVMAWIGMFIVPILSGFFFISFTHVKRLRYSQSSNAEYILALLGWGIAITAISLYFSASICEVLTFSRNYLGFTKPTGICSDFQFSIPSSSLNHESASSVPNSPIEFDSAAVLSLIVALGSAIVFNLYTLAARFFQSILGLFKLWEFFAGVFYGSVIALLVWLLGWLYEANEIQFLQEFVRGLNGKKLLLFTLIAVWNFFRNPTRRAAKAVYIIEYGNGNDFVLYKATSMNKLVQISLLSGKVYIGKPIDVSSPRSIDPSFIKIIPYLSGYRSTDTKAVEIVTDYTRLSKSLGFPDMAGNEMTFTLKIEIEEEDLNMLPEELRSKGKIDIADLIYAIKVSEIETITIWDERIYALLNMQPAEPSVIEL